MKKTKIITTIGPASKDEEILKGLILNGMNVARINLTHASHAFCEDIITKIRRLNDSLHTNVSIMLDTKGPDVTVGRFESGSAYLNTGDKIRVYMNPILGDSTKFSVSYPRLIHDVKVNDTIKINDGLIELTVLDKGIDYLLCEVVTGGFVEDHKGINVIGVRLNMPFLSKEDEEDIAFANEMDVDFLALTHVSNAEDVLEINDILINLGNDHIAIIPKIENERAVDAIDEIIDISDGVMIARGDLGVELPFERVPGIQRTIISKCHRAGKVSIVATEMMASMENAARPTRAEVSDVASAVTDGVDAVMLSGETTIGKYPVQTVDIMSKIIATAEEDVNYYELLDKAMRTEKQDTTGSIAYSVVECASRLKANAIVTPTMSGYTARKISRFRPSCPILAISPDAKTVRNLTIYYGIYPETIKPIKSFDEMMERSKEVSKQITKAEVGDRIVITGGYPLKEVKHTNFMKIEDL